jgi:hypothetical protein
VIPEREKIGCGSIQELIATLAADAQQVLAEYEAAQAAGYDRGTDLTARELQGLRTALGRVLAWRDGLPAEGAVAAFNRGRDYQDALPTAERRAS